MVGKCSFGGMIMIWNFVVFIVNLRATNNFVILDSSELGVMFSCLREGKSAMGLASSAYKCRKHSTQLLMSLI